MLILLCSLILMVLAEIPILRSYEYEGDSKGVAIVSAILHILIASIIGVAIICFGIAILEHYF